MTPGKTTKTRPSQGATLYGRPAVPAAVFLMGWLWGNVLGLGKDLVSEFQRFTAQATLSGEFAWTSRVVEPTPHPELTNLHWIREIQTDGRDFVVRTIVRINDGSPTLTYGDGFRTFETPEGDYYDILEGDRYWSISAFNGISTWQIGDTFGQVLKPPPIPEATLALSCQSQLEVITFVRTLGISGQVQAHLVWQGLAFRLTGYSFVPTKIRDGVPIRLGVESHETTGRLVVSNGIPSFVLLTNHVKTSAIVAVRKIEYVYDLSRNETLPVGFRFFRRRMQDWVPERTVEFSVLKPGAAGPISALATIESLKKQGYFEEESPIFTIFGKEWPIFTYTGANQVYTNAAGEVVPIPSSVLPRPGFLASVLEHIWSWVFVLLCLLSFPILYLVLRKAREIPSKPTTTNPER